MGIAHLDAEASEEERAAWQERERLLKEEAEAKVRARARGTRDERRGLV